ncbi:hypothetical protein A3E39_01500 [Candidatus Uhrbacteria bacterium RIFCSPHIGHO2_12_FULL_60_25]|uniref:YdbS-like PH domain-containing protein n=1 Tax=Candidatus Uhrbacteria bacterium RIFCSPHIGHO2_12_FULL_60_25 TaxID=1802399 RepID=A0A1F7UJU0_9BACT|nr:MAG: hypothetical protein A3D73_04100 [Candidatus Uhrbacteria bacterium RIFCSPHIGHO2_02_FULL_60_44]OGL78515.1 MAG: hypothetical protein A3E39_01500 [Candidatus Uhrbacteria bacterium RIFCSPHIGHO2_12_FULL_60_25]
MIDLSKLPGTAADEENVFFLRSHWLILLPIAIGFLIVLVLPFAVWFGVNASNPEFFGTPGYATLYVLGASIFFLYAWLFLFQSFIDYFLDIWIITTHRVIDIQQTGLFGRTTSELLLDRVQDVSSEVKGFIHTIFDYGDVRVQTAGEKERFVFENVPHPVHVSKRILELAERRRSAQAIPAVND